MSESSGTTMYDCSGNQNYGNYPDGSTQLYQSSALTSAVVTLAGQTRATATYQAATSAPVFNPGWAVLAPMPAVSGGGIFNTTAGSGFSIEGWCAKHLLVHAGVAHWQSLFAST